MPAPTAEQRAATRDRPTRSPVMYQSWCHLLFLHWRWDPAAIQATLPKGLYVDTYDNAAYLGVVPFWMDAVRPRFCPPIPGLSWFLELNLRTYVHTANGTPGVWFYSLDCNHPLAVLLARTFFSLPYIHARQTGSRPKPTRHLIGDKLPADENPAYADFFSQRRSANFPRNPLSASSVARSPSDGPIAHSHFRYAAAAAPQPARAGTLEAFLVERYFLFSRSTRNGRLYQGQVSHAPYLVSPAHVALAETSLFAENGFPVPARPADHAMTSPGVDVSIYGLHALK